MTTLSKYHQAHKHSSLHRLEIEASKVCGCFYCLSIFFPSNITEWADEDKDGTGQTGLCPQCGIDSVMGDRSGYSIDKDFLSAMHKVWFNISK